jgi:hypothetical protein
VKPQVRAAFGVERNCHDRTEPRRPHNPDSPGSLSGWKLVAALLVIAATAVATLLITGLPEAVIIVIAPLVLVLGVTASRDDGEAQPEAG